MDSLTITDGGSVSSAAHDPAGGPRRARRDLGIAVSERPDVTDSADRDRTLVRDLLEHRRTKGARLPHGGGSRRSSTPRWVCSSAALLRRGRHGGAAPRQDLSSPRPSSAACCTRCCPGSAPLRSLTS